MSEINGSNQSERLDGTSGDDTIWGYAGNDTIAGLAGNDRIITGDGVDVVDGGAGNDEINGFITNSLLGEYSTYGSTGAKTIDGGDGNDVIFGGSDADRIQGGSGNDAIYGAAGDDVINGGDGADSLFGQDGNDQINGGDGNDTLMGDLGNDTLSGGLGIDDLEGGAGNDVYDVTDMTDYIFDESGTDTAYVSKSFVKLPSSIETVVYTNGALALPYWISALMFDSGAGLNDATLLGSAKTFKYAFPSQLPVYYNGTSQADGSFVGFSEIQKARAVTALTYIESIIDVKFVFATETNALNTLSFGTNAQTDSAGYAYGPSTQSDGNDVFLNKTDPYVKDLADNSYGSQILIHEIGHALGLKHPFSGADAANGNAEPPYLEKGVEDFTIWSVMSYTNNPIEQNQLKYSPLDIAALQYIYGPSTMARTGSDTYFISETEANFIWDGGGTDKISAVSSSQGVTIYLEPGYWGYVGSTKEAYISKAGQVTVNFGTQIENLDGSGFGDGLYGNALNNVINGNAGNDTIQAFAGNDTIDGGDGQDTVVYALNASNYTVTAITGGYQVLAKSGNEGTDTLFNVESLKFANKTVVAADFVAAGGEKDPAVAKFWKDSTKAPTETKKADAVNLTDAIAILKMIVGLNVNSNNTPLSPYQAVAADFDQDGSVGLTDAIGVLKMVVGLSAPTPTWKYYDDTKLGSSYTSAQALNPKGWTTSAVITDTGTADSSVKLIGVLSGDVDGSWMGV